MLCCPESLGQHCIGFLPVKCCPKSIKTKLHMIFTYAILSGASQTTLHRDLTCPMLSKEYKENIAQYLFLCKVV